MAEADRMRIVKAIRGADGDLLLAAELLGVTYAVLRKRMAEIGIRVKTSIEIE
ncbi:helix-turn-helix domain-containing protein [Slackia isoflavoniconvertens]|uniref:helix-turn-helix domain-containing protein n=1 Tax=Slackia isoflavoniconvertens TaxID=572010 RepID=UPI003A8FE1ED